VGQTKRFQPFQPHGTSLVHATEHVNAEVGPSTLPPPNDPSVGLPTPQPSGGISEMTVDAENQPSTEEGQVAVSNFYRSHIPRVSDR
jgi:hypothetical protein